MDKIFKIDFITQDEDAWVGLNDRKMFMDYEENVIENYNFQGFAEQLMAVWYGFTDMDIEDGEPKCE